jgi:hypothetical protein
MRPIMLALFAVVALMMLGSATSAENGFFGGN